MEERMQQEQQEGKPAELPPPDAVIEIRYDPQTLGLSTTFRYGSDLEMPANHYAAWLHRNNDTLSAMAAREFMAVRQAQAEVHARYVLPAVPEEPNAAKKPTIVESATPRLVSPHGGPLQ